MWGEVPTWAEIAALLLGVGTVALLLRINGRRAKQDPPPPAMEWQGGRV
jgi:hypothetical protein